MWKWAQGAVASVTGAAEPEYGAEAFQSVDSTLEPGENPYSNLSKEDYEWQQPSQSHVETQTFYFNAPAEQGGYYGFAQLIHSNPINLSYTSQFTFLLLKEDDPEFRVWTSQRLESHGVAESGIDFSAEGFDIKLNDALDTFTFTTVASDETQIDLSFSRGNTSGFKIGKDGKSRYGHDLENPWGVMRHIFWPRCTVSGRVIVHPATADGEELRIDLKDAQGLFVMALQGMKPHHAAARWNFLNFQGPTVSVVVMEFVTPGSYGCGRSAIGAIVKDGELVACSVGVEVDHKDSSEDDVGWPAPGAIEFRLKGPPVSGSGPEITATVTGDLKHQVARVDVMAEIPAFVKRVVSGVSGAKPYIYQYNNELEATVTIDGKAHTERGRAFSEATFIS